MSQISLATTGVELVNKHTRKHLFLGAINFVLPWAEMVTAKGKAVVHSMVNAPVRSTNT